MESPEGHHPMPMYEASEGVLDWLGWGWMPHSAACAIKLC